MVIALKIVLVGVNLLLIQICENGDSFVVCGVWLQVESNSLALCDKINAEFLTIGTFRVNLFSDG